MAKRGHFWVMHFVKQPFLTLPQDCAEDLSLLSWFQPWQKPHTSLCHSSSSEPGLFESGWNLNMGRWGRTPDNCFGDRRLSWPPGECFCPPDLQSTALQASTGGRSSKASSVKRCLLPFLLKAGWSPCSQNWPTTQDPRIKQICVCGFFFFLQLHWEYLEGSEQV